MTSREQFEEWVSDNGKFKRALERKGDAYLLATINTQWEAWQASESASQQKLTDMAVQLANAESKCRELAAENAEMRSSIDATIGWQESTDPENGESVRMLVDIKTPATDAFLAEVRAQGVEAFVMDFTEPAVMNNGTFYNEDLVEASNEFAAQLRNGAAL